MLYYTKLFSPQRGGIFEFRTLTCVPRRTEVLPAAARGDVLPLAKVGHPQVPCLSNSTVALSNDEPP